MRKFIFSIIFLLSFYSQAQNITVDANTYTPQELIENVLINSTCISNVVVTNVVGGNFNSADESFGYFDATGTSFPFQNGLVLSTGKLQHVEGPNTTLSDDNATNWLGDSDLETILNESNTTNATVIEFEFTSISNQISFNYIFASEEYQENSSSTCNYSDLFGFLIRPKNEVDYTNIALVPNTQTPVKVTTVHPLIPGGCAAQNETYFESWNGSTAPINFNGQTKVLTATATIIPNETYHVKLVIADEQNYRFDSAVFLEAGSFNHGTSLGVDRLLSTNNPLCFNETLELNAATLGTGNSYKWFKNGVEIYSETNSIYTVKEAGLYKVEVTLANNCTSNGEITVEYAKDLNTNPNYLRLCDDNNDGYTFFDLHLADPFYADMTDLTVVDFFLTAQDANDNLNAIADPSVFFNTELNQVVYARIENEFGCFEVQTLTLDSSTSYLDFSEFNACDEDGDGKAIFDLNELRNLIQPEVSSPATVYFFASYNDAAYHQNPLPNTYENTTLNSQEIWVKAQDIYCELLTTVYLRTFDKPELQDDETHFYCLNTYPETIKLEAGVLSNLSTTNYNYEWFKNEVSLAINNDYIEVNEVGEYKVIVSNAVDCTSERKVVVEASESAIIEDIIINENTVTVVTSGIGDYEFSLDNGFSEFQQSNVFLNVSSGDHIVYVIDVNGCEIVEERFTISGGILFPNFFTPNNDGVNDTWNSIELIPNAKIYIFDRFGKLLKQFNSLEKGWDGTFNGKSLPNNDYWYKVIYDDGKIESGHFTLKR